LIREARKQDCKQAAVLILDAIHDIANALTGESEKGKVLKQLERYYCQERNRISYRNCLVKAVDDYPVGIVVAYDGKDAEALDEPIRDHLRQKSGKPPVIDQEADANDYYLDTISVSPVHGGKGYGTELLQAAMQHAKELGYGTVSLNVEESNARARQLYERLGFSAKKTIMINGHLYYYMIKPV